MVLYALIASLFTLGCSDWFRLETTRHRRSAGKRLSLDCEYIFKSMEGKIEDSWLHGTRDVMRRRECSTGRLKSWMKMEKLFGAMEVWIKRQFEISISIISGSKSASCEKALIIFLPHAWTALPFGGRSRTGSGPANTRHNNRRAVQTSSTMSTSHACGDNGSIVKLQPMRKEVPENTVRLGRMSNGLGMPRLARRCADSRLLACSLELWYVPELDIKYHSTCLKASARMIVSETKPRLKVNARIVTCTPDSSSLESWTGSEVLRSWLEILFKMSTISASLSGCGRWRKLRNMERTAAKRPDYLHISYREIREREKERGRRTMRRVVLVMSCHTANCLASSLALNSL